MIEGSNGEPEDGGDDEPVVYLGRYQWPTFDALGVDSARSWRSEVAAND